MLAVMWWAVDEDGRSWCYREYTEKGLIVQEAAKRIKDLTAADETIAATYAPPDMWSRQKDTGRTMAELYLQNGVSITRANNNRVQGHMMMKDAFAQTPLRDPYAIKMMTPEGGRAPDKLPGMVFFSTCKQVIGDVQDIQADEKNPNDCATSPHDITHCVDAVRYYAVSRQMVTEAEKDAEYYDEEDDELEDYRTFMTGGVPTASYLNYSARS